ncbi:hypothetical protein P43SY_006053 [Pythium insidiosum]|uniref:Uncharacterized protein n=1 Tax=Pythium insidiosum TaxID=114742 RepID=A0AAD5LYP8_PYTIN|nr:hypothetical protein P43SY_006053 [Pythium insidiosum]
MTTDFDKDERYMATSDLCNELNNNVELGSYLEAKVCSAVLKQLDDKSNDVQSIAVKCLGILVTKVQETQVADICSKLSELILHGKPELRDIYAIGLKTILADVSQKTGAFVAKNLCVRLLAGLNKDAQTAVKAETLDILTDLLRRFGHDIATEHETIMNLLVVQLTDASPLVRKLLALVLTFMKYDPNYSYGDSDDEEDESMDNDEEEYSDVDEGDYSDDDDTSWKRNSEGPSSFIS